MEPKTCLLDELSLSAYTAFSTHFLQDFEHLSSITLQFFTLKNKYFINNFQLLRLFHGRLFRVFKRPATGSTKNIFTLQKIPIFINSSQDETLSSTSHA